MVIPHEGTVCVGVADLRATPDESAERVDQAHFGERLTVLGGREGWVYVQGEDHYFGWICSGDLVEPTTIVTGPHIVTALFADVHERPDAASSVLTRVPVGTRIQPSGDRYRSVGTREPAPLHDGWIQFGPL